MEDIKKININGCKIVKSTSSKLIGYKLIGDTIEVGDEIKIEKDGKEKLFPVGAIIKIKENTYHILNSNIGIIIRK